MYPLAVIQQKRRVETKGAMQNMRTRSREATERALRKFHQSSNNNLSMGASISEVRKSIGQIADVGVI